MFMLTLSLPPTLTPSAAQGSPDATEDVTVGMFSSAQQHLVAAVHDSDRALTSAFSGAGGAGGGAGGDGGISLPTLTEEEAANLDFFLAQGGIEVAEIDRLEAYLSERTRRLEVESIGILFSNETARHAESLAALMAECTDSSGDIEAWAATHDSSLSKMRIGIEKIEARSEQLEVRVSPPLCAFCAHYFSRFAPLPLAFAIAHELD